MLWSFQVSVISSIVLWTWALTILARRSCYRMATWTLLNAIPWLTWVFLYQKDAEHILVESNTGFLLASLPWLWTLILLSCSMCTRITSASLLVVAVVHTFTCVVVFTLPPASVRSWTLLYLVPILAMIFLVVLWIAWELNKQSGSCPTRVLELSEEEETQYRHDRWSYYIIVVLLLVYVGIHWTVVRSWWDSFPAAEQGTRIAYDLSFILLSISTVLSSKQYSRSIATSSGRCCAWDTGDDVTRLRTSSQTVETEIPVSQSAYADDAVLSPTASAAEDADTITI